jgi:hypothetical protein
MSKYIHLKVHVPDNQRQKIIDAIKEDTGVSNQFSHEHVVGDHILAFTKPQATHSMNNYAKGQGVIKFSKTQLRHNRPKPIEGGFLQALIPLALTAGKWLLSNVVSIISEWSFNGNWVSYRK